ncbi:hypothetical protein Tco_0298437 [Tanacetum coccineum]
MRRKGVGDEEVVVGEGVVVTSSSLEMLTNSCLGRIMVSLVFLEGLEEEALVEFMVELFEEDEDGKKNREDGDSSYGIGFVLNFVKFNLVHFGDKEMLTVIEAVSVNCVSFMRILRLREVARATARIALEFAPDMSPPIRRKYHDSVAFATGCKRIKNSKRCNRKIRIPIAMWPCRVEEKMTLKEVDGQTVEEIETKIIAKDGTITRVPGKFQGYETSEEEPVEQPRRHDLYGFVDHPQLQQGNPMNEFAPHRLPQPKGNMNGR